MERPFLPVTTPAAVEDLFVQSAEHPVILLKHDPSCPISQAAYQDMQQATQDVAIIDVARAPDLSGDIAARTGVTHESPQVIVLRDGNAIWSASHYDITYAAVAQIGLQSHQRSTD
jgi:bacillithiol system protein YtxJ